MGRRKRQASPEDFVVDVERGDAAVGVKSAQFVASSAAAARTGTRFGLRELDDMTEAMPSLTRAQKDRERILPRDTTAPLGHERMRRQLPIPDSVRNPISSRQRKARSITKRATQQRLPRTQKVALRDLVAEPAGWEQVNRDLYAVVGDGDAAKPATQRQVARVDRAIQAYEKAHTRGHLVYTNVRFPDSINQANLEGFTRNRFTPGTTVDFDQYTMGAHCLHEVEPVAGDPDAGRTAVFEIHTRRGMYLGASDSRDDTAHLLPRSLALTVVSTHQARFRTPDGTIRTRTVIQLADPDATT